MLPILCVMDVLGLRAYRGKGEWQGVKHMMLPAILGIVIGALSFGSLGQHHQGAARRDLGCVLDLPVDPCAARSQDLAARNGCGRGYGAASRASRPRWPTLGGPPITIYLWPKKIDRMQFMAITVVFFTVVNAVKLIPFAIPRPTEPDQSRHLAVY